MVPHHEIFSYKGTQFDLGPEVPNILSWSFYSSAYSVRFMTSFDDGETAPIFTRALFVATKCTLTHPIYFLA